MCFTRKVCKSTVLSHPFKLMSLSSPNFETREKLQMYVRVSNTAVWVGKELDKVYFAYRSQNVYLSKDFFPVIVKLVIAVKQLNCKSSKIIHFVLYKCDCCNVAHKEC